MSPTSYQAAPPRVIDITRLAALLQLRVLLLLLCSSMAVVVDNATHGHGDHFFGASVLLDRFPKARFVATPSAVQVMKEQVSPEYVAKFWESRFPNQLPKRLVIAEELRTSGLQLEGESLLAVPLMFPDTAGTTCLHVPSL